MGRSGLVLLIAAWGLTACIVGKDRPSDGGDSFQPLGDLPVPVPDAMADRGPDGSAADGPGPGPDALAEEAGATDASPCGNARLDEGEACDGELFSVADCGALGFLFGGSLGCTTACAFDLSACRGGCGNGLREPREVCDAADLAGTQCSDFGFRSGALACTSSCSAFDMSDCGFPCATGRGGENCAVCEVGYDPADCSGCEHPYQALPDGSCELNTECGPRHLLAHGMVGDSHGAADFVLEGTSTEPIVRDTLTGFSWRRCPVGMLWLPSGNTCTGTPSTFGFAALATACQGNWGGFDDWRVPRPHEQESLVNYSGSSALDMSLFPNFGSMLTPLFWSSMLVGTGVAYSFDSLSGSGVAEQTTTRQGVLCVRAPDLPAAKRRFRVMNGNGTEIADLWARLVWKRCAEGQSWYASSGTCGGTPRDRGHADAVGDCAGNQGWRLPTARELRALREFCQATDSIGMPDAVAFPGLRRGRYWSSTSGGQQAYWSVGLGQTGTGKEAEATQNLVLCVRDL